MSLIPTDRRPARRARAALLACLALGVPVRAAPRALASPGDVGASVGAAVREVLLVTPALRSRAVAEGLRRAAVERGVRVYLLADARFVNEPAGYLSGLSLVPGIQVRLLRGVQGSRATIDRQVTVSGPLLADVASPLRPGVTRAQDDPRVVRAAAAWFTRAWPGARPYRYTVPATPTRAAPR